MEYEETGYITKPGWKWTSLSPGDLRLLRPGEKPPVTTGFTRENQGGKSFNPYTYIWHSTGSDIYNSVTSGSSTIPGAAPPRRPDSPEPSSDNSGQRQRILASPPPFKKKSPEQCKENLGRLARFIRQRLELDEQAALHGADSSTPMVLIYSNYEAETTAATGIESFRSFHDAGFPIAFFQVEHREAVIPEHLEVASHMKLGDRNLRDALDDVTMWLKSYSDLSSWGSDSSQEDDDGSSDEGESEGRRCQDETGGAKRQPKRRDLNDEVKKPAPRNLQEVNKQARGAIDCDSSLVEEQGGASIASGKDGEEESRSIAAQKLNDGEK